MQKKAFATMSLSPILFPETSHNNGSEIHAPAFVASEPEPDGPPQWLGIALLIIALGIAGMAGYLVALLCGVS